MYKKYLENLFTVGLKYFFDLDPAYFHNAYMMVLMVPFIIKLAIIGVAAYMLDGLATVKADMLDMKHNVVTYKQAWDNSDMKETLVNNVRVLKQNLIEKNFRTH